MQPKFIKVKECFSIRGRGFFTELQHSFNGIPPNTQLKECTTGALWLVTKRVLSDNLLSIDSETTFDNETAIETMRHSYTSLSDRNVAIEKELNKRANKIYWYFLQPVTTTPYLQPQSGDLFVLVQNNQT